MPSTLKDVPGFTPHGGALELRIAGQEEVADLRAKAKDLPTIEAKSRRVLSDLELLAVGAVSPNRGFMTKADYESVVSDMRLANGLPWSLPITLSATDEEVAELETGKPAAIVHEGEVVAIIDVEDIFTYDVKREARAHLQDDRREPPRRRVPLLAGAELRRWRRHGSEERVRSRVLRVPPHAAAAPREDRRARMANRRCVPDP